MCMTSFIENNYIHINDNKHCFGDEKFDPKKLKSVSLSINEALKLRDALHTVELHDGKLLN